MEQNNDVAVKNQGGQPSAAETDEHFAKALELYLQGVISGSEIGRRLELSAQAGVELVKKVRASFARIQRSPLYGGLCRQNKKHQRSVGAFCGRASRYRCKTFLALVTEMYNSLVHNSPH